METKKRSYTVMVVILLILFAVFLVYIDKNRIESPKLSLSEVCSHNESIIHNEIGVYTDYVEIYNNSSQRVDLKDYYLSDNMDNLYQTNLQYKTIEPYGYAVVFLDSWNTEFQISDGETIYLTNSKGFVLDKVTIENLDNNQSYSYDSTDQTWKISNVPTPGQANEFIELYKPEIEAPTATISGGFFESPFYVKLSGNGIIYYTLDGSTPDTNSEVYTDPIYIYDRSEENNRICDASEITTIDENMFNDEPAVKGICLRAVIYNSEGFYGRELTETYFVDVLEKTGFNELTTVSIVTDPYNLFDYNYGIYTKGMIYDIYKEEASDVYEYDANYTMKGKGWRRPASIQILNNEETHNSKTAKICIRGGYSRSYTQKSFNVFLEEDSSQRPLVLRATVSCNPYENIAPKYRDYILAKLNIYNNIAVQESSLCQLFLDGEYWGVYSMTEKISEEMISEKYGIESENISLVKYPASEDENDEFLNLVDEINELDLSQNKNYEYVKTKIDIDSLIKYYSIEMYLNNYDWLSNRSDRMNNFAAWKSKNIDSQKEYSDGKWRFILFDLDCTVGTQNKYDYKFNPFTTENEEKKNWLLFSKLYENEQFREDFKIGLESVGKDCFSYNRVKEMLEEEFLKYRLSIVESQKRFLDPEYSLEELNAETSLFLDFFEKRYEFISFYLDKLNNIYEQETK